MTYLQALLEAESALQRRRGWYTRTRARASWVKSQRRAAELEAAHSRADRPRNRRLTQFGHLVNNR